MLRTLYLVLSAADEADLSRQVAARSDTVAFVDGVLWPDEIPPLVPTIEAATSNRVLLWDRQVFPRLPLVRTAHGEIHGPSTRYVICLDRSAPTRFGGLEVLVSGMLTWSTTDPDQSGRGLSLVGMAGGPEGDASQDPCSGIPRGARLPRGYWRGGLVESTLRPDDSG